MNRNDTSGSILHRMEATAFLSILEVWSLALVLAGAPQPTGTLPAGRRERNQAETPQR